MILVIDNYDSFVHNLARYFRQLGCQTTVWRNDRLHLEQIRQLNPKAIVISPGPCTPADAGQLLDVLGLLAADYPMLGVCLGHQALIESFGGAIVRANQPRHGRSSEIDHDGSRLFAGLNSPLTVGRYHSLVAERESVPDCFEITATLGDIVMAIQHRTLPIVGVQFHPESVLTERGYQIISNFLKIAGVQLSNLDMTEPQFQISTFAGD